MNLEKNVGLERMQLMLAHHLIECVDECGCKFDQGPGAEGSHYASAAQNPFKSDGIVCNNCIFFDGEDCEIVDGVIEAEAICKFWIIPEGLLTGAAADYVAAQEAAEAAAENEGMPQMQMAHKAWGSLFTPLA